ncbi:uncharacterized protein [Ambystoma mexicanum]|uniref:uncharacterized protein n=1 Tax=Ambystoma mexicanum TaxID=8296 RepID=UPI0037E80D2B
MPSLGGGPGRPASDPRATTCAEGHSFQTAGCSQLPIASQPNLPPAQTILQEVQAPLIDTKACNAMFQSFLRQSPRFNPIQEDMICAGHAIGQKSFCLGDTGGPLVCNVNSTWLLTGVASWEPTSCAAPFSPGVYTLVAFYIGWIKEYVPNANCNVASASITTPSVSVSPASLSPKTTSSPSTALQAMAYSSTTSRAISASTPLTRPQTLISAIFTSRASTSSQMNVTNSTTSRLNTSNSFSTHPTRDSTLGLTVTISSQINVTNSTTSRLNSSNIFVTHPTRVSTLGLTVTINATVTTTVVATKPVTNSITNSSPKTISTSTTPFISPIWLNMTSLSGITAPKNATIPTMASTSNFTTTQVSPMAISMVSIVNITAASNSTTKVATLGNVTPNALGTTEAAHSGDTAHSTNSAVTAPSKMITMLTSNVATKLSNLTSSVSSESTTGSHIVLSASIPTSTSKSFTNSLPSNTTRFTTTDNSITIPSTHATMTSHNMSTTTLSARTAFQTTLSHNLSSEFSRNTASVTMTQLTAVHPIITTILHSNISTPQGSTTRNVFNVSTTSPAPTALRTTFPHNVSSEEAHSSASLTMTQLSTASSIFTTILHSTISALHMNATKTVLVTKTEGSAPFSVLPTNIVPMTEINSTSSTTKATTSRVSTMHSTNTSGNEWLNNLVQG